MTESKITPDDPRLTAYALGELEASEIAAVAAAVAADPQLQKEVEEIREMAGGLEQALQTEPLPETEPIDPNQPAAAVIEFPNEPRKARRLSFSWMAGLAAAGIVLLVALQVQISHVSHPSAPSHAVVMDAILPAPEPVAQPPKVTLEAISNSRSGEETAQDQRLRELENQMPRPTSGVRGASTDVFAMSSLRSASGHHSVTDPSTAGEDYAATSDHGWRQVINEPLSTFGLDVDSASYANVRRFMQDGSLPPIDAVKIEEMINAFTYDYPAPNAAAEVPLMVNLEVASAPWAPQHRLVRVGIKAREMAVGDRAPANLVFLLDVSGSMDNPRKLPLVKEAMRLLVDQLKVGDRVAIVTYAGQSGLALPSTPVSERRVIREALVSLQPGGSTHGSSGIHLAYDVAKANFIPGGINRVILCTDGDFNVGTTGLTELENLIAEKAASDVFLTALGFGTGNYQDDTLETLANRGNGQHGYIDSVREARRLLVEQVNGTLATVAQDVKIQVEFNPTQVQAYRLIGYNNRRLRNEEFNDDAVDAGEIGAGHSVTALYEVVPVGAPPPPAGSGAADALRYQAVPDNPGSPAEHAHEMLIVKLRAQPPGGGMSRLTEHPLVDRGLRFEQASPDFKFAAAVAGFGLQLRQMPVAQHISYAMVTDWARAGMGQDPGGYRREFLELVDAADRLTR